VTRALIDLSNGFANAVERGGRTIVSVNKGGQAGVSGTIWRDGLVVTAEHTIRDQEELTLELPSGTSSSATVVGRDPNTDIALLRLKESVPAIAGFADAAQVRVGQFVLAIRATRKARPGRKSRHHQRPEGSLGAVGGRPNRITEIAPSLIFQLI
jgi:S1-C subfamily serine protease